MSCETNYSSDSDVSIESDENINDNEYVVLKEFPEYVIQKEFPHVIKKIKTGKIAKPTLNKSNGYYQVCLNGKNHLFHRILARQFISNPENLPCVDHKNLRRDDNRLENLRFCTNKQNCNNRRNNIIVNEIPDDAIVVESYKEYTFENLYFSPSTNRFYFDSGIDFIERKPIIDKRSNNSYFIHARDINENDITIYYNKFKKEYNLI